MMYFLDSSRKDEALGLVTDLSENLEDRILKVISVYDFSLHL